MINRKKIANIKASKTQKKEKIIMANISKHGYERIKERLCIKSVSKAERQVKLARERGTTFDFSEDKTNRLIRYIKSREERTNDVYASLYNGVVYLFSKGTNTLVTVYPLRKGIDAFYKRTSHPYKRSDYRVLDEAMCW